jgi:hypothetical protein
MRRLLILLVLLSGCTTSYTLPVFTPLVVHAHVPVAVPVPVPVAMPTFIKADPIRNAGDVPIVSDVQSHLAAGNEYLEADQVGCVHESTHGVNGVLRNQYHQPAFYVLHNRAVLLKEPNTTLAVVAGQIPVSLRGMDYESHLIEMQRYWNDQPTYVFDEWVAYTNGAEARQVLGITARHETVELALEYCVYAAYVPQDKQTKLFYRWQVERVMNLFYEHSGPPSAYLKNLREADDAAGLRKWLRDTYGSKWTKKVLGF